MRYIHSITSPRFVLALLLWAAAWTGCEGEGRQFARVFQIENMAQTIGGPAAAGRPGDYLLENDKIRAVIHGRHNMRSTFPITNGGLIDLDLQRRDPSSSAGRGRDTFYELGPMVNLKVSNSTTMSSGQCTELTAGTPSVGDAPCPRDKKDAMIEDCSRVTASGRGEDIMGILSLLDLAIQRTYKAENLIITTDYDLCPGERMVRVTTTARLDASEEPTVVPMDDLKVQTGLLDVLLGQHTGQDCAKDPCKTGEQCDDLLINLQAGGINMEMKRCRKPQQKLAGVLAGDFIFFSAKVHVFIPRSGFDHESYIRGLFDTGGDIFSYPLSMPVVTGVSDDVSYSYFNTGGDVMIPVFAEAFTASMTNRYACPRNDKDCLDGKKLRFRRYVSVGKGDVASALEGFYEMQGLEAGKIEGHVVDARSRKPVSGIDVFVFKVPQAWAAKDNGYIQAQSYESLVSLHKKESGVEADLGVISQFKTDVGQDYVKDGSFSGKLPVGQLTEKRHRSVACDATVCRYILVAHEDGRPISRLFPVHVQKDETARITMVAAEHATLNYDVFDGAGRALPSKLTIGHCFPECARDEDCDLGTCDDSTHICVPRGGYTGPATCRPDQLWSDGTCTCRKEGRVPLALGGSRYADNTTQVVLSASGSGRVAVPPGTYQVIASRGFEHEISRQFVTLAPGTVKQLKAVLPRVIDTGGWISADFHVHGPNSVDAPTGYTRRVTSHLAEGVELLTATDHDYLTDYGPTIYALGATSWIKSQVGLEVSPLDYGHFIGFPLLFDENAEQNGAFHWRVNEPQSDPTLPDWKNMVPSGIFKKLREIGSLGADKTMVFVAHFYDYFTFYDLDPFTLEMPGFSLTALFNQVLQPSKFSGEFDGVEGFNGKNLDVVRRPTYSEIKTYNVELAKIIEGYKNKSYDERQAAYGALSAATQRNILERTEAEQKLAISYYNPGFECRCTADADCGVGSICDADTGGCTSSCTSDAHCAAALVAAKREACQQKGSQANRKTCRRLSQTCTKTADCTAAWSGGAKEICQGGSCELACARDKDCTGDAMRPICDTKTQACVGITAATANDPCLTLRGTIDDWFQLLNHGVNRTMLGNSDSHGTYSTEAGIPRNYVKSSTDLPRGISIPEIAANVKAMRSFTTYGPFVELKINGKEMGQTVKISKGEKVELALKIQSPLWFDVDRVEIYRNGEFLKTITGSVTCDKATMPCIKVPNDRVINFEGKISDIPTRDSWYVVLVMGLDGKTLAPVYSSTPVARLGMFELIQRLTPLLPPLRSLRTPLSPSMTVVRPLAVTNPIWVDVGGDGLTPLISPPGWAPARDQAGKLSSPLTSGAPRKPPAHDHRQGLGRMVTDTKRFKEMVKQGQITPRLFQQAVDQLRYLGSGSSH